LQTSEHLLKSYNDQLQNDLIKANKRLTEKDEDFRMAQIKEKRATDEKNATAEAWADEKRRTKANTIVDNFPSISGQPEGNEVETILSKFE